ncbi:hypothetical protein [Rhizobium sp. NFR03]|uniref:hypothetical protein n=1 Tax=Rhizobium sp. NFR03 TaxID=1566263 RepID=UPI0008CBA2E1|nr:hypothetical protein [Rhizobium sp. NFR03]SES45234.1 hypothetical protein SAMN03159406_04645 [Rhizobium sp. NFR03]
MSLKEISGEVDGRYARIDGELVPLVSNVWMDGVTYANPFTPPLHDVRDPKDREFLVVVLQKHRVVVTDDVAVRNGDGALIPLTRRRYLGLYAIENPAYAPASGLSFTLGPLIADLAAP